MEQSYNITQASAQTGFSIIYTVGCIIIFIIEIMALWRIFEKAGKKGWISLIPFYNTFTLFEIAGYNGWMFLLLLVPIVNIVFGILVPIKLAKKFGKSSGFAIGLILLAPIFYIILAFDKSRYEGNKKDEEPQVEPNTPNVPNTPSQIDNQTNTLNNTNPQQNQNSIQTNTVNNQVNPQPSVEPQTKSQVNTVNNQINPQQSQTPVEQTTVNNIQNPQQNIQPAPNPQQTQPNPQTMPANNTKVNPTTLPNTNEKVNPTNMFNELPKQDQAPQNPQDIFNSKPQN